MNEARECLRVVKAPKWDILTISIPKVLTDEELERLKTKVSDIVKEFTK